MYCAADAGRLPECNVLFIIRIIPSILAVDGQLMVTRRLFRNAITTSDANYHVAL